MGNRTSSPQIAANSCNSVTVVSNLINPGNAPGAISVNRESAATFFAPIPFKIRDFQDFQDFQDLHLLPTVIKHLIFHMLYGTNVGNIRDYGITQNTAPFVLEYTNSSKNRCHLLTLRLTGNRFIKCVYHYASCTHYYSHEPNSQSCWILMNPSNLTLEYIVKDILGDGIILNAFWNYFFKSYKFVDIYMMVHDVSPDKAKSIIKKLNATKINLNEHCRLKESMKFASEDQNIEKPAQYLIQVINQRIKAWQDDDDKRR